MVGVGPPLETIGRAPLEFDTPVDYSNFPPGVIRSVCSSATNAALQIFG